MRFKNIFLHLIFVLLFLMVSASIAYYLFFPIYTSNEIIIPYSLHPYNICATYPEAWEKIKSFFIIIHIIFSILLSNASYNFLHRIFNFSR